MEIIFNFKIIKVEKGATIEALAINSRQMIVINGKMYKYESIKKYLINEKDIIDVFNVLVGG